MKGLNKYCQLGGFSANHWLAEDWFIYDMPETLGQCGELAKTWSANYDDIPNWAIKLKL